jgi:cytosine/adenosine deaminase-related metal-dependent hydrolase
MLARTGSLEVLTMASDGGAHMRGREEDIGSIEVGKVADLADLVELNVNPLGDIKGTTNIALVMKGGVTQTRSMRSGRPLTHTVPRPGQAKTHTREALRANRKSGTRLQRRDPCGYR